MRKYLTYFNTKNVKNICIFCNLLIYTKFIAVCVYFGKICAIY